MRRRARRDDNHSAVVEALRKCGIWVWDTAGLGNGFPDLLVCHRKTFVLLEVKDGAKTRSQRELTELERQFFATCPGPVYVVEDSRGAVMAVQAATRDAA